MLIVATGQDLAAAGARRDIATLLADTRVRTESYAAAAFNYSAVNNRGVAAARGELVCFLNDDIELIAPDWLDQLVARVSQPGIGAAGPMLYYPTDLIQHAGVLLGVGGVADHAFRTMLRGTAADFGRAAVEQDYSCLTAACLLVRRDVFERVGGFDETLPVAFNDVDLCLRVRRAGTRIVWTPTAEMYHHESLTFGPHDAPERAAQFDRDVALMQIRWAEVLANDHCL